MALSLSSLQPQNFRPITVPDPSKRTRSIMEVQQMLDQRRAGAQTEELRGLQIDKAKREATSEATALQKATAIDGILSAKKGVLDDEALNAIAGIDPQFAMALRESETAKARTVKSDEAAEAVAANKAATGQFEALEGQPGFEREKAPVLQGSYLLPLDSGADVPPPLVQPPGMVGPLTHPEMTIPSAVPRGTPIRMSPLTRLGKQKQDSDAAARKLAEETALARARQQAEKDFSTTNPPAQPQPTADIQNYQFAVKQGYKGTFEQWQTEDANRRRSLVVQPPAPASGGGTEISDALGRATMTMPQTRRNQTIRTVNTMVERGDIASARATIRQAALESEPVAVRQQIQGRREVAGALVDIQELLKKVPTNLLVGTAEDVARKLGTSTNAEYVKLGNRLTILNQSYRRSMTGAQFSIPEAQEYGKIFPNYSTTAPVNAALIESLTDAFRRNDQTYWDYKLGPGWADAPAQAAPPADQRKEQRSPSTGQYRHSLDGGKTWLNGRLPPQ